MDTCVYCYKPLGEISHLYLCAECFEKWSKAYCDKHGEKLDLDYLCPACESAANDQYERGYQESIEEDWRQMSYIEDECETDGDWESDDYDELYLRYVPYYADVYENNLRGIMTHIGRVFKPFGWALEKIRKARVTLRKAVDRDFRRHYDEIPF